MGEKRMQKMEKAKKYLIWNGGLRRAHLQHLDTVMV